MNGSENLSDTAVIVGGGIAGMLAAVRLQLGGHAVTVLEKGAEAGYLCNSRLTQGVIHCALADPLSPPEQLLQRISVATGGEADPELGQALAEDLLRAVRFLQSVGVRFLKGPFHYQSFVFSPPSVTTLGRSWEGRGGDVTLRHLEAVLTKNGGRLLRGHSAVELLLEAGRVTGVRGETAGGGAFEIRAATTTLCDGGAQAGVELLGARGWPAPERIFQRNARSGTGDGLRMAEAAGAAITPMERFYGHLLSIDAFRIPALAFYPFLDYVMSSAILVDRTGRRFLDEGKGGIAAANALAQRPDPQDAFVIADDRTWRQRGRFRLMSPNPVLVANGGTLHSAPTLEALARNAGLEAGALVETVAACNRAVETGESTRLLPARSSDEGPLLPIVEPPFHAIPVCPGITYTMGGIRIDAGSHVMDRDGVAIPGLLAAGCTTGGLEGGGDRGGYVGGLSRSVVTALRAAETILGDRFAAPPSPRGAAGELVLPFTWKNIRYA